MGSACSCNKNNSTGGKNEKRTTVTDPEGSSLRVILYYLILTIFREEWKLHKVSNSVQWLREWTLEDGEIFIKLTKNLGMVYLCL